MMSQQAAERRFFMRVGVLAGGLPLLITFTSFLGVSTRGDLRLDDFMPPLLGMGVLGITIIGLFGTMTVLLSLRERRAISRLKQNSWVSWPQYETLEAWQALVEQETAEMRRFSGISWLSVIVTTILFGFVAGFVVYLFRTERSLAQSNPLILLLPVGSIYAVVMMISLGLPLIEQRRIEQLYRRRIEHPIPCVSIGAQGMCHEDQGYTSFRSLNSRLTDAKFVPDQSALMLSFWYRSQSRTRHRTVQVYVPHGAAMEAQALVQRLKSEVIR